MDKLSKVLIFFPASSRLSEKRESGDLSWKWKENEVSDEIPSTFHFLSQLETGSETYSSKQFRIIVIGGVGNKGCVQVCMENVHFSSFY